MNCKDIINLLSPYLEGELEEQKKEALEVHLKGCSGCRKELTLLEAAIQSVKDLEEVVPPANLLVKINEALDKRLLRSRLSLVWEKMTRPIDIPVQAKSLALAASILLILYLAIGPGQIYRTSKMSSEITPPAKVSLEVAKIELSIPRPAANIPRPDSYCIAPAKMAEARRAIAISSFLPANPEAMAKGREELNGKHIFLPSGNEHSLADGRRSLPSPKIFKN